MVMVGRTRKSSVSYEKSRLKELLFFMVQKHQPDCSLCGSPFRHEDVLPSRGSDRLTEHHADANHYNNDLSNRVLVHRRCHKAYHQKDNINFWRQFK